MRRRGVVAPDGIPLGRSMAQVAAFIEWLDRRLEMREAEIQAIAAAEQIVMQEESYDRRTMPPITREELAELLADIPEPEAP